MPEVVLISRYFNEIRNFFGGNELYGKSVHESNFINGFFELKYQ